MGEIFLYKDPLGNTISAHRQGTPTPHDMARKLTVFLWFLGSHGKGNPNTTCDWHRKPPLPKDLKMLAHMEAQDDLAL